MGMGLVQRFGSEGALIFVSKLLDPSAIKGLALASLAGLLWSLPASIVNAVLQGLLSGVNWDSWRVGAGVGAIASAFVVAGTRFSRSEGTDVQIAMISTGVLMGVLFWAIAIRPRRNLRLAKDRTTSLSTDRKV
jgi:hypothetical protein